MKTDSIVRMNSWSEGWRMRVWEKIFDGWWVGNGISQELVNEYLDEIEPVWRNVEKVASTRMRWIVSQIALMDSQHISWSKMGFSALSESYQSCPPIFPDVFFGSMQRLLRFEELFWEFWSFSPFCSRFVGDRILSVTSLEPILRISCRFVRD
jgi:hypothetical protein